MSKEMSRQNGVRSAVVFGVMLALSGCSTAPTDLGGEREEVGTQLLPLTVQQESMLAGVFDPANSSVWLAEKFVAGVELAGGDREQLVITMDGQDAALQADLTATLSNELIPGDVVDIMQADHRFITLQVMSPEALDGLAEADAETSFGVCVWAD
jgi:hypothetical protein